VVIEPGEVFFMDPATGRSCFRLGFSSIAQERIEPGIERLARLQMRLPN
jgi:GntR family transcriptional regulator/MocR family aminotransferase